MSGFGFSTVFGNYIQISVSEFDECTKENGWEYVGGDEGGYTLCRKNQFVFWNADEGQAYRVVEERIQV